MVELGVDEGLLGANPLQGVRKVQRQLVELPLRSGELVVDDLLVAPRLLEVRPPLLGVVGHRDLQLRRHTLHLQKPLVGVDICLQDLMVIITIVIWLLHLVLLVHEVVLLAVCWHLILAHRMDLRVAVHLRLVGKALVGIARRAPLEARASQHLSQEAVEDLADGFAAACLQLPGHGLDLDAIVLQYDQHIRDHGVRVVVLIPVGLQPNKLQGPHHQLSEILELVGRVRSRIREEGARDRLHLRIAEAGLVVEQHEHVDDLIIELKRLHVVRPLRSFLGCWGGRHARRVPPAGACRRGGAWGQWPGKLWACT
mmetsp:Transcript_41622/g.86959  ORF Transcript_41622/g.86959 Transcript_41622/m.86959 type:complete len:312 (+) Transcript_41622:450-1385(+)